MHPISAEIEEDLPQVSREVADTRRFLDAQEHTDKR